MTKFSSKSFTLFYLLVLLNPEWDSFVHWNIFARCRRKSRYFYHSQISSEARWQLRRPTNFLRGKCFQKLFFPILLPHLTSLHPTSPQLTSHANSRDDNRTRLARLPLEMVHGWLNIWKRTNHLWTWVRQCVLIMERPKKSKWNNRTLSDQKFFNYPFRERFHF